MIKRSLITLGILFFLTVFLGISHGFQNLGTFSPLLPPFMAISLAFITHEVILSLLIGIFLGSFMTFQVDGFTGFLVTLNSSFFKIADTYVLNALADSDHMSIIVFTLFIGGVVGLISHSGGLQGIIHRLSGMARNSVMSQFYTWAMGVMIFFDDYANSLIVGNTMRPLTDRYKVSREKLSFIVDATAAPVASLVIVSTWIGYEIGLIQDVFKNTNIELDPYMAFIYSIPYSFYCILMLVFILFIIFSKRDFFSMYTAELRARTKGEVLKKGSTPISGDDEMDLDEFNPNLTPKARNAVIPIVILIFGVLVGLYITGYSSIVADKGVEAAENSGLKDILGNANSFKALIWASFLSSVVSIVMITQQKIMCFKEAIQVWIKGAKSMFLAAMILTLAWSLGAVLKDIKTAECVTNLLQSTISISALPVLIFLISAVTSFSTGTSWGAMAIIIPISIPLATKLGVTLPPEEFTPILFASIGSILSGCVFGDHCSPISDTTILSSTASQVDHMDHVTTQLPYSVTVGVVACLVGYIPAGFGFNPYIGLVIGVILLAAIVFILGKKVPNISQ